MRADPRRIAGLDALRGLAVLLVMVHHSWPAALPGSGVVGVVMFFSLSGHLVTGVLIDELERTGRVDLGRFYRRRARRLVPALVVMMIGLTLVTWVVDPLGDRDQLGLTWLWAITWTGDLPFGHASAATFHLWTLAMEEQFYLVWPVLLIWLRPQRALWVAAVGTGAAVVATAVWFRSAPDAAYSLPTGWAICFVIGAASRVYGARLRSVRWLGSTAPAPAALAPAALAGLLVLGLVELRGHAWTYLVAGPMIAGLTAVMVLAAPVSVPRSGRWLVGLGTVSYAAYLWNYPVALWLRPVPGGGMLALVLTLLLAAASWRWVERRPTRPAAAVGMTPTAIGLR